MSPHDKRSEEPYFQTRREARRIKAHEQALSRCVRRLKETMPILGLRNPKIGIDHENWAYCDAFDWVISFHCGQLWLAAQLSGDPAFVIGAQARTHIFRHLLRHPHKTDHDLGFQFSLSCVAQWKTTGHIEARAFALQAADLLVQRFRAEGRYLKAWNPRENDPDHAAFVAGRMIADTMQNLALLYWASQETGIEAYRAVADAHAMTSITYLIRADGTSYHTFVFDPATGKPLRGETHQGFAHESCWARGQAWMIHGLAQSYHYTRHLPYLESAFTLAKTAEALMGHQELPIWDYRLPEGEPPHVDSSAAAIMASGLYLLAAELKTAKAQKTCLDFGDRLLAGLLKTCDLTDSPNAVGLLAHGAAHVSLGKYDNMLPYGDYYFMEALMRSLGHEHFFW